MYTLFDLVAIILIGVLGLIGLRRGLIEEALKLIGMILAAILAVRFYGLGVRLIQNIFNLSEGVLTVAGFIIVFLIVYLAVQLLSSILKRIVSRLKLIWLDRLSGLGFGALKGILIMAIVTWCFGIFSGTAVIDKLASSSPTYIYLDETGDILLKTLGLQDKAAALQESIRGIFRMETPLPVPLPGMPDSLGHRLEYIDSQTSTRRATP